VDKALLFWLDRGILKDLGGGNYKLLEDAEQLKAKNPRRGQLGELPTSTNIFPSALTSVRIVTMMEENLETESAAKEQLEKMKVFWQVSLFCAYVSSYSTQYLPPSVSTFVVC
jgi:hypothetical protein